MLNIHFDFDGPVEKPDEYTMGYMTIENDGQTLDSKDISGRGLMMVFFSLTSLLESVVKLNEFKPKDFRFVGEDSSFILIFQKFGKNNINILKDKKIFCTVTFNDFARAIWELSESLFDEYDGLFEADNIAVKDWLKVREEAVTICSTIRKNRIKS